MLPLLDGQKGTDVVHQAPCSVQRDAWFKRASDSYQTQESYQQPWKSNQPPSLISLRASSIFEVGIYHPK